MKKIFCVLLAVLALVITVSCKNDVDSLIKKGDAALEKGNYDRAIDDYTKAIQLDPRMAYSYYMRGLAYTEKADYNKAIADFSEAIPFYPDEALLYLERGFAYMQMGNNEQARADINKTLELAPNHQTAIHLAGSLGINNITADSPMSGLEYAKSFREQEGYALVQDIRRHYWLYDTYSNHNGNSDLIHLQILPQWVKKMGYTIDYDKIEKTDPNTVLASSVKALMTQLGCDVSLTLVTKDTWGGSYDYVIINEYDKSRRVYFSTIYPLGE